IARADTAEKTIDDPYMRLLGRHEGAGLRQDRDQCVLAQERRLAGHVGSGDEPKPTGAIGGQIAIVGDEGLRVLRSERRLDHRMATTLDMEGETVVDDR